MPRVLLIDADLRLPQLYQVLGAPRSPGLADYLEGGVDEFSIIQRGPAPNFYFIPSGNAVSNPSELIGNGRLKGTSDAASALLSTGSFWTRRP